jgi:hypothetical protein
MLLSSVARADGVRDEIGRGKDDRAEIEDKPNALMHTGTTAWDLLSFHHCDVVTGRPGNTRPDRPANPAPITTTGSSMRACHDHRLSAVQVGGNAVL